MERVSSLKALGYAATAFWLAFCVLVLLYKAIV